MTFATLIRSIIETFFFVVAFLPREYDKMVKYAQLSRTWFQNLSAPRRKTRIPQSRTGLEALEQRLLLTVDAFIDAEQTLQISGSDADDRIVATVDSDSQEITIGESDEDGSNLARFSLKDLRRIELDAADGNDFVNIIDADGTLDEHQVELHLSGGDGDNVVFLSTRPIDYREIQQLQTLVNAGAELEDIAQQIAATTQDGLLEESKTFIADATSRVIDATNALKEQAETELFGPANALMEISQTDLLDTAEELLAELEDVGSRTDTMSVQMEATAEKYVATADSITGSATDRKRGATDRRMNVLGQRAERLGSAFAVQSRSLADEAKALGDELTSITEKAQQMAEGPVAELEDAADNIAVRMDEMERSAEQFTAETETHLAAVGHRVVGIAERLTGLNVRLEDALGRFTKDLTDAAARIAPAKHSHGMCEVETVHTYNGGSDEDFFIPLSAMTSSWLINGGGGDDILFGGFAGDEINGGDGTDLIFGLRGDDLIHGDDGVDFLFGEFVFDIPGITGDDCVFGDADIDLVVGDNGVELFSSNPGGDDHLHGGSEIDIVIGDDISDIFDPAHAGGSDTIYGDEGIDALFGTGGDDTIEGGEHIDFMMGGGDNDTMYGIDNTFTGDGWIWNKPRRNRKNFEGSQGRSRR